MKDGDGTDAERSNAHTEMMAIAELADANPAVEGTTNLGAATNNGNGDPVTSLVLRAPVPANQHPSAVYLARLALGSRRIMATSLDVMAGLLTSYRCNMQTLEWSALRYQYT